MHLMSACNWLINVNVIYMNMHILICSDPPHGMLRALQMFDFANLIFNLRVDLQHLPQALHRIA